MSRRDQIKMSATEVAEFLSSQRVINVATMGPKGRPHLAPLWYLPRVDDVEAPRLETWTYGSSQKVANLRRLPEATVLVEDGEQYEQLRGVSMECDVELIDDADETLRIGIDLMHRYTFEDESVEVPPSLVDVLRKQAAKRVGIVFTPTKVVSWDHSKLGGVY
ncbi:pyridoxamine 5'-phosphate oxidase family protein [Haloechinothrix salitolerans]|uniref:Pyridoxamine 5'-phosphate oxidase family protein n=1 Tax=Haloechinothrix salitolerans TaxID=926830 RepID=A0ABW2BUL8_9PSEU